MTRPIILLDVDGVLADFTTPVLEHANNLLWTKMKRALQETTNEDNRPILEHSLVALEDITDYNIAKAFPGLDPKEVFECCMRQGWCRALRPLPGAIEAVKALQALDEVYAVTKPFDSPFWKQEREEWLGVVTGIPWDHVIFAHDKSMVQGDVMVEDNPEQLFAWQMAMDTSPHLIAPLLWDQPWNRSENKYLYRVKTWDEVIAKVMQVEEELA